MLLRASVVRSLLLCALFMSALGDEICGTQDGLALLKTIRNLTDPSLDSETLLYTPTHEHYKTCPDYTLSCMSFEMQMLLDEWTMDDKRNKNISKLQGIVDVILDLITGNQTEIQASGCVRCEHFPEESPMAFLDALQRTLQHINTMCSTTPPTATSPSHSMRVPGSTPSSTGLTQRR